MMMKVILAILLSIAARACVTPTGISEDGAGDTIAAAAVDGALTQVPFLWLPLVGPIIESILKHETPIQFRVALWHGSWVYNVVSTYHEKALDTWGQKEVSDQRRRCRDGLTAQEFTRYEKLTAAYAFAYSGITLFPDLRDTYAEIMEGVLGFKWSLLELDHKDISTPWGLARTVIDEDDEFMKMDGWNADGSLASSFHKQPYADFDFEDARGRKYDRYEPTRRLDLEKGLYYWQPLIESNMKGYFARQEHITPFIGATARLYGISDDEFVKFRTLSPEHYGYAADYESDTDFVLAYSKVLATNETKKVLVEVMDSKFTSLLPIQINWSIRSGFNEFEFWYNDAALVTAMYDATVLVWREKVLWNRVRPTTIVQDLRRGQTVEGYGGPETDGIQEMLGEEWEPYIRTMPHGEFPSGSSCICTAFAEIIQLMSGSDKSDIPITHTVEAGSSVKMDGTPAEDITFTWGAWSEVEKVCGESRWWGGMHFEGSIPSGHDLCSGNIAPLVHEKMLKLLKGNPNGALADRSDPSITVRPYDSRCSSDKKCMFELAYPRGIKEKHCTPMRTCKPSSLETCVLRNRVCALDEDCCTGVCKGGRCKKN